MVIRRPAEVISPGPDSPGPEGRVTGQGLNLSGLIARIPKINRSGDQSEDNKRLVIRGCLQKLLEMFKEDNDLIVPTLNAVQQKIFTGASPSKDVSKWPYTYHQLWKLPKYYKASLLCNISEGELSEELLDKIDKQSDAAIEAMFHMFAQTTPNTPLPRCCLDKAVCKAFFTDRIADLGHRWKGWAARSVDSHGNIDWKKGGCYRVEWSTEEADAKATCITYLTGESEAVPEYITITKAFTVESPENDMGARLHRETVALMLSDLWKKSGKGPHEFLIPKGRPHQEVQGHYYDLAKKYSAQQAQKTKQADAGVALDNENFASKGDADRKAVKAAAAKKRAEEMAAKRRRIMRLDSPE